MGVIYLLISISLLVAILFFVVFIYAIKSGQFDDAYTPSIRMLFENDPTKKEKTDPILKTKQNS